jgi:hypothetical protein
MLDETYCLRIVTEFLNSKNIPFVYCNARVVFFMYNHGCQIKLDNDEYIMSIQTHPHISGRSFAETAILDKNGNFAPDKFNYYDDIIRHDTPEELFTHIMDILNK